MSNEELAVLIQNGQKEQIPQLWSQVEKFVNMQASKRVSGIPLKQHYKEDLCQCGYFAMLKAIDGYKPGGSFIGYLDLHLRTAFNEALELRTVKQKKDPLSNAISIETPVESEDGDLTLGDTIKDPTADEEFDLITDNAEKRVIRQILYDFADRLPEKQKEYFALLMKNNLNNSKTCRELNVSRQWGNELYHKLKRKLRHHFNEHREELAELDILYGSAVRHVGVQSWRDRQFTSRTEELALLSIERKTS